MDDPKDEPIPFNPKPDTAEGVAELIATTREMVEGYIKPEIGQMFLPDGTPVPMVLSKDGFEVLDSGQFDDWRNNPVRRRGTATMLDLASFIAFTQRFADADSVVFGDNSRTAPKLTTVFDYNRAGSEAAPRFGQHRAAFAFPLSDEWKAWTALDAQPMEMPKFARFIEDRIIDVMPLAQVLPTEEQGQYIDLLGGFDRLASPAKLMEISTGLQVYENVETVQAVKLQTGESKMVFQNTQQGGTSGDMTVPSMFVIAIPVFVNGPAYQIVVRLRYRPAGGKVLFFYEMWRTDKVFDDAFNEAIGKVAEETTLPVLLGKPE